MRWLTLALWIIACLAIGGFGARWTAPEIPGWYRTLAKPSFNPPGWIFGPVWTTLYILMAIAAWRVTDSPDSPSRTLGITLFVIQLALNLAWSWIFFHKHAIGPAALEVALLWCAIGATTLVFSRASAISAWLMAPIGPGSPSPPSSTPPSGASTQTPAEPDPLAPTQPRGLP